MPKCATCGGHVDWIETDDYCVPDDCPRCVPRWIELPDPAPHPTSPSPDPVVVRLERELEELRGFYAKLYGCVRGYCNADPQVRGEAYRDLEATLQYVDGYDAEYGWPACYERKFREVKELREKLEEERQIRVDIGKSMECNSASLFQEMRANAELNNDNTRLRGLLREAVETWDAEPTYECTLPIRWFDEVKAALEGKP